MENKIKRIKELVEELNKASILYYNGKQSNITDKEWDSKFDELKQLEEETNFILNISPTQKVGAETVSQLERVQHTKKMLSLDKTKDVNVLKKFLGSQIGVLSWKEDGLTIILHYNKGVLIDAITRGGGDIGSRVLHNAKVFKNIPQKINYKGKLVVRGEGLISREDFKIININNEYANPRNLASGSIMQLDSNITKQRNLQFKAFTIAECDKEFELYTEQLEWLSNLGFDTVEYDIVSNSSIEESVERFKKSINKYQFATDGLVLMYNDLAYGKSLGSTSHHENNAMALKWKDNTKETTLRGVQFQVGRTGVLTPVAIFDNVELEGTTVNKASLHNLSILKSLELGIGDKISCYKSNMIIPQIDDNLTRSNTFKIPTHCPVCGGEVEIKSSEQAEFLYCTNPRCNAKISQKIKHYCSKSAMDIDGFSIKTIEKFISKGFIKELSDIYKLEQYKKEIINMEGFGIKSYNKLIQSIEKSKLCKLGSFIFAIGIPNVGKSTAIDLAQYFKTIDKFMNCTKSELYKVKDIGDITSDSVYTYINNQDNISMINELLKYIKFENEVIEEAKDNLFKNKKVYCTGSFENYKKDDLKNILNKLGAKYTSGFNKSLDYLIVGNKKGSSKVQKAKDNDILIMTESEFSQIIDGLE